MKRGASLVACITSKYDFIEVGREFLADAFLTLTDSAGSGMPDIRNDIIGVAEVILKKRKKRLICSFLSVI